MAERRMFTKTIIDSDPFLDMPLSTQALYFHLAMRADDDGFINNPKKIQRMVGCSDDDAKILIVKRFILAFESGVIVIKHWRMHNYIRADRYKPTVYQDEKALLTLDENNSYTAVGIPDVNQDGYQMDTQVRLGKVRLGKVSIELGKDSMEESKERGNVANAPTHPPKNRYGEFQNVLLTDDELTKLQDKFIDAGERIERLSTYIASKGKRYKNHYATILSWAKKDKPSKADELEQKKRKLDAIIAGGDDFGNCDWNSQAPADDFGVLPEHKD